MAIRGPYKRRNQRNRSLGKGALQGFQYLGLFEDWNTNTQAHRFELVIENMLYLVDSETPNLPFEINDVLCFKFSEYQGVRTIDLHSIGMVVDPATLNRFRNSLTGEDSNPNSTVSVANAQNAQHNDYHGSAPADNQEAQAYHYANTYDQHQAPNEPSHQQVAYAYENA